MKHLIQTTNHKRTVFQQLCKIVEEGFEVVVELLKGNYDKAVMELIDLAKCTLKAAETICTEKGIDFEAKLKENDDKNEKRGYHL